jgi:hypothetical protein
MVMISKFQMSNSKIFPRSERTAHYAIKIIYACVSLTILFFALDIELPNISKTDYL